MHSDDTRDRSCARAHNRDGRVAVLNRKSDQTPVVSHVQELITETGE